MATNLSGHRVYGAFAAIVVLGDAVFLSMLAFPPADDASVVSLLAPAVLFLAPNGLGFIVAPLMGPGAIWVVAAADAALAALLFVGWRWPPRRRALLMITVFAAGVLLAFAGLAVAMDATLRFMGRVLHGG